MDFGKLSDISGVDFSLPEDHTINEGVLAGAGPSEARQVWVGLARWSDSTLREVIYPRGTSSGEFLYHYSRHFTTIELNTTFYRIPSRERVESWCDDSPGDFLFCPKVNQAISHHRNFSDTRGPTEDFLESLDYFGEKLGQCYLQLSPYFSPQRGKELFQYLETWPREFPLSIEFRHPDWFGRKAVTNRAFELLKDLKMGTVITDTAGRRDCVHMGLTTSTAFIRFVGNSLHESDYERIDSWIGRIERWFDRGLEKLYFFVHQPEENLAVELSVYLVEELNRRLNLDLRGPEPIENKTPRQQTLFE